MISRCIVLKIRNVSDKRCGENHNILFMFNNPPPPKNHAVYEILWKNIVEPDRPHVTIWRMRIACWIPNATVTHSEYVTFNAFP